MAKKHIRIPVFIPHLGCPHRCSFCDQVRTSHHRTVPDAAAIMDKVHRYRATLSDPAPLVEIAFFGGTFTAIPRRLQEELLSTAARCRAENLVQGIRVSTRPDCIDAGALELLSRYGVDTVELGVQSFDDMVLSAASRGHDAEDARRAAAMVRAGGFSLVIQLMPGLPGDTAERSLTTAREAAALAPSAVRIYPTVVIEGTALADDYRAGVYRPLSLDEALERCVDICAIFDEAHIPVIRLGLHPLDPAEAAGVLAGPYHPAFGHLVHCRTRHREMTRILSENPWPAGGRIRIRVPADRLGQYRGNAGETASILAKQFNFSSVSIEAATISDLQIEALTLGSLCDKEAPRCRPKNGSS